MKNLANCTPTEFLKQTMKIRRLAADWLDLTKVLEFRQKVPKRTEKMSDNDYRKLVISTMKNVFLDMFDAIFEKHEKETLSLLALMNFVEPEKVDDYSMGDYLGNVADMLQDKNVLNFFTSLAQLDQMNI